MIRSGFGGSGLSQSKRNLRLVSIIARYYRETGQFAFFFPLNTKSLFLKGGICIIFLGALTQNVFAASSSRAVARGNRLYEEEKFDEAIEKYNEALINLPDSEIINFDIGAACYKKGDYDKAIDSFTKSLTTDSPEIESKANYNIGNIKYRQGQLKENTDLESTISIYRESLDYYKRALELDEDAKDAKFNHEFVEKRIKMLIDKLEQQEQQKSKQNKTGEQKEGKKEDETEQQDSQKSGQENQEQDQSQKEPQAQDTEKEEEAQGFPEDREDEREQGRQPEKETEEMSEKEARMLLEGYRQEEEANNNYDRGKIKVDPRVLKDW